MRGEPQQEHEQDYRESLAARELARHGLGLVEDSDPSVLRIAIAKQAISV